MMERQGHQSKELIPAAKENPLGRAMKAGSSGSRGAARLENVWAVPQLYLPPGVTQRAIPGPAGKQHQCHLELIRNAGSTPPRAAGEPPPGRVGVCGKNKTTESPLQVKFGKALAKNI